jgi:phosphatidylglycerol:prolipoprotein diacylglycerol transferase
MSLLHLVDPVALQSPAFELFGRSFEPGIHWYGLMYALAFLSAWLLGRARIRAGRLPGVDENGFGDLLFYGMLGVVLGGRIGYVVFYGFADFLANPLMLLKVWEGGMSFHGGLLGVLLASWLWSRQHRLHFMDTMDFVAPLVPLGIAAGRMGNFINGELWGRVTDLPWGMAFRGAGDLPRHPSQLYQFAGEGLALFVILWWFSSRPRRKGEVSALFLIGYGVLRFLAEFAREPDAFLGYLAFGLTMGQWLCLPMILAGLALWAWSRRSIRS